MKNKYSSTYDKIEEILENGHLDPKIQTALYNAACVILCKETFWNTMKFYMGDNSIKDDIMKTFISMNDIIDKLLKGIDIDGLYYEKVTLEG